MIDFDKLSKFKPLFKFYSMQLDYPEKLTYHPKTFESVSNAPLSVYSHIEAYHDAVMQYSLDENRQIYTDTFDFKKRHSLFMTYAHFEDGKERGQMLAKLKVLYEMFGLEMSSSELSDYLPLMCEFLYASDWENDDRKDDSFSLCIGVIEDGTYHLQSGLEESNNHYVHIVRALRATFKEAMIKAEARGEA